MSYITRCPACGTAFRVVPDQLKISEGWVRCGSCQEVFDAGASLQSWPLDDLPASQEVMPQLATAPELVADPVVEEISAPSAPESVGRGPLAPDDVEFEFDPDWMDSDDPGRHRDPPPESVAVSDGFPPLYSDYQTSPELAAERDPDPDPDPGPDPEPSPGLAPEGASDEAAMSPPESLTDPAPGPAPVHAVAGATTPWPPAASPDDAQADPAESLSFVRQAERRAFWRRPAVRATQGMLALALLVSLALYWVVVERDRLAASQPAWQPALQALCRPLGCALAPLREIESVLIDSTALRRRSEGRYVFDVTLRNTGRWPVAVPALELTLTDIADQVLVRRVFPASDWVGDRMVLPPGSDLPVRLELSLDALEARTMTGYRALLFYP